MRLLDSADPPTYNPAMNPTAANSGLPFRKMHGLGNDFVVLDARAHAITLTPDSARAIANRRTGIGCDQILIIEPAKNGGDAFMAVRNADGGVVESCGNGARCVADVLINESGKDKITLETLAGPITAARAPHGHVSVDMGPVRTAWADIPLSAQHDTLHVGYTLGPLSDPVAVNVGNPHAVFFVADVMAIDLAAIGPKIEHDPLFPARVNVEAVQVLSRDHVRMRVWERGVGITQACGTGACAVAVAAARRNLTGRTVTVTLDGGDLVIEWRGDNHVVMTGPVATVFAGIYGGRRRS